jgi:hypothetical protein
MTDPPESTDPKPDLWHRIFHGRRPGPLLGPWLSTGIVAAIAYGFERKLPAFRDVVGTLYWILLAIALIATARWLRTRSGDRRSSDRRRKGQRKN